MLLIALFLSGSLINAQIKLAKETNLTQNSSDDRYASYSPDGKHIVFESNRDGTWQIYLMDTNGSNQKKITSHKSNNRKPTWHPSGTVILFESDRTGRLQLFTINTESLEVNQLTKFDKREPLFADYSPDGKHIAMSLKETDDKSNIVLIDNNGEIIKKLTDTNLRSHFPRWSSDGKEIVYFSRKDTGNEDDEIYKLNLETGTEQRLTSWPKHNFCPSWSNDNSKIVYVTSMENSRPEIYIMDANGENQIRITNNNDGDTLPSWSSKEDKLLITGYRDGNFEICELQLKFGKQ